MSLGTLAGRSESSAPVKNRNAFGPGPTQALLLDSGCIPEEFTWFEPGILGVWPGTDRFYPPFDLTLVSARASVNTAPTGQSLKVDVNKNGTTVFTTQANRPTIAAAGFTALAAGIDVVDVALGDYLTFDIDQVGSTIAGSDLAVTLGYLVCTRSATPAVADISCSPAVAFALNPIRSYHLDETSGTVAVDATGNYNAAYRANSTLAQASLIVCDTSGYSVNLLSTQAAPGGIYAAADNPALTAYTHSFWLKKHGGSMTVFMNGDYFTNMTQFMYIDSGAHMVWGMVGGSGNIISSVLPDDIPIHVAATAASAGAGHLYIDAVDQGSVTMPSFTHFAPAGRWIMGVGGAENAPTGDFHAYIDDYNIFDRVLSASEVSEIYMAGI